MPSPDSHGQWCPSAVHRHVCRHVHQHVRRCVHRHEYGCHLSVCTLDSVVVGCSCERSIGARPLLVAPLAIEVGHEVELLVEPLLSELLEQLCLSMCVDMCIDMCIGMHLEVSVDMGRSMHVYGHVPTCG